MSYTQDLNCFSHWDDPIHDGTKTQKVVKEVKTEIDKDTLGAKKPAWSSSVGIVGHPQPEDRTNTLFRIKHGLNDEKVTTAKPQKVYAGCDTRDAAYAGWNVST